MSKKRMTYRSERRQSRSNPNKSLLPYIMVYANYKRVGNKWQVELVADADQLGQIKKILKARSLQEAFDNTMNEVEALSAFLDYACATLHLYEGDEHNFIHLIEEEKINTSRRTIR